MKLSSFQLPVELGSQVDNVRTIINQNDKTIWFVANDLFKILGINSKGGRSDALAVLDEDERSSFKTNTSGGEQNMVIVSESGFYSLIMRSRKPIAKPFQKWVTREVLPEIRKNGFYITKEAKSNPSNKLIKEARGILETRLGIDNTRDELIDYINDYLKEENWNLQSLPSALSNVYQHLHIATRGMIASQILEDEFKKLSDTTDRELTITNHRQKRKLPKVYASDYLVAQNYYSEKEVDLFNERFNDVLRRVKSFIKFKRNTISPTDVLALLKKASRDMVYETSNEVEGTEYQGIKAKKLKEILDTFNKGSVEYDKALILIDEIGDGNKFTLGKS
jgi:prophage antirepressor-like protein